MRIILLLFAFVFAGCLGSNSQYVCPDGSVVAYQILCPEYSKEIPNIDPEDYSEIVLNPYKEKIVKANGIATVYLNITKKDRAYFGTTYSAVPGFPAKISFAPKTITLDDRSDIQLVHLKDDLYSFNESMPEIPGDYIFGLGFIKDGVQQRMPTYNVTVIDKVDGGMALKVANRFMFSKIDPSMPFDKMVQKWRVVSKNATLANGTWEVSLEIEYQKCGIDYYSDICDTQHVTGNFMIDEKTGLILG